MAAAEPSAEPSAHDEPPSWLSSIMNLQSDLWGLRHNWPPFLKESESSYEWHVPTNEVYKQPKGDCDITGNFREAREALDWSYHIKPIAPRQQLQDKILATAMKPSCERRERPWIVFTAGAMGAGKSYALHALHAERLFPLDTFQTIDPDALKHELPEMPGYLLFDRPSAATKLHRESTQMADVLLEHSLRAGCNVLVDGSLRDHKYYAWLFGDLRKRFPSHRLAIVHISAPPEVVHRRVAERAANSKDGRAVPRELVDASLKQVPESVRVLGPLVDYVAEVENDDDGLRLRRGGADWGAFRAAWKDSPSQPSGVDEAQVDVRVEGGGGESRSDGGNRRRSIGEPRSGVLGLRSWRSKNSSVELCQRCDLPNTAERQKRMYRQAIQLSGDCEPNVCVRCKLEGYLDAGQMCACYATKSASVVNKFKVVERRFLGLMWTLGWYAMPPVVSSKAVNARGSQVQEEPDDERLPPGLSRREDHERRLYEPSASVSAKRPTESTGGSVE